MDLLVFDEKYVVGDCVIYDSLYAPTKRRSVKIANRTIGPFRVIAQVKNDVTCHHLCTGVVNVFFHGEKLKLFTETEEQACSDLNGSCV